MKASVACSGPRPWVLCCLLVTTGACRVGKADLGEWLEDGASTRPPTQPVVLLTPSAPSVLTGIQAALSEESVDPAGTHEVAYTWAWTRDGDLVADLTGDEVPGAMVRKGEVWGLVVTAEVRGLTTASERVTTTVSNSMPTIGSVGFADTAPTVEEPIEAVVMVEDLDGDEVVLSYAWTLNGVSLDLAADVALLPAGTGMAGDVFGVTVTPSDGEELGFPENATVEVSNSSPTVGDVSLAPRWPSDGDQLTCSVSGLADVDGHDVSVQVDWYRGTSPDAAADELVASETLAVGVTTAFLSPGDHLDGDDESADGYVWACEAHAVDELGGASPSVVSEVRTSLQCDSGTSVEVAGIEFVRICGDRGVAMGCTADTVMPGNNASCGRELYRDAPGAHRTDTFITRDHFISVHEVTVADYLSGFGISLADIRAASSSAADPHVVTYVPQYGDAPDDPSTATGDWVDFDPGTAIGGVTWDQAAALANALSVQAGLPVCYDDLGDLEMQTSASLVAAGLHIYDCLGIRLPTELEWDNAARCGYCDGEADCWYGWVEDRAVCPGTDTEACHVDWSNLGYVDANWNVRSAEQFDPIDPSTASGGYPLRLVNSTWAGSDYIAANACGVRQMYGNASEWMHDTWSPLQDGDVLTDDFVFDPVSRSDSTSADYQVSPQPDWRVVRGPNLFDFGGANTKPARMGSTIGLRRVVDRSSQAAEEQRASDGGTASGDRALNGIRLALSIPVAE